MAPHPIPRHRLAIAAALALGSIGTIVPIASSPAPTRAVPAAPPNVSEAARAPSTSTENPAPAAVRSLATQVAILKKVVRRDRFRRGRARGTWVPRKVGGRLAYFHQL